MFPPGDLLEARGFLVYDKGATIFLFFALACQLSVCVTNIEIDGFKLCAWFNLDRGAQRNSKVINNERWDYG